jgi:hypothetical protein
MRLLPRSPAGTWALAAAAWLGLSAAAWWLLPPRPQAAHDHSLAEGFTSSPGCYRAMRNECLAKQVAWNITCVIHAMYELGIAAMMGGADESRDVLPMIRRG